MLVGLSESHKQTIRPKLQNKIGQIKHFLSEVISDVKPSHLILTSE